MYGCDRKKIPYRRDTVTKAARKAKRPKRASAWVVDKRKNSQAMIVNPGKFIDLIVRDGTLPLICDYLPLSEEVDSYEYKRRSTFSLVTSPKPVHNLTDDDVNGLLSVAETVKCDYSKSPDRVINPSYKNHAEVDTFLGSPDSIGDCTSVTFLTLLRFYLGKDTDAWHNVATASSTFIELPNPHFHTFFSKTQGGDETDKGVLTYIQNDLFYAIKDSAGMYLNTNAMGWWCIGIGKGNFKTSHPDLWHGEFDADKEAYLAFWGKRDGTDKTMVITHYDTLRDHLIESAKRDLKITLDRLKSTNQTIYSCVSGIIEVKGKISGITQESTTKKRFSRMFEKNAKPLLSCCEMINNHLNVVMNGDSMI